MREMFIQPDVKFQWYDVTCLLQTDNAQGKQEDIVYPTIIELHFGLIHATRQELLDH